MAPHYPLHGAGKRGMMRARIGPGVFNSGKRVMVDEGDIVAVFKSVHRVMKAEKILKASLQGIKVIPMPRQLSADCGMAIKFPAALLGEVSRLLGEQKVSFVELWQKIDGELQLLP